MVKAKRSPIAAAPDSSDVEGAEQHRQHHLHPSSASVRPGKSGPDPPGYVRRDALFARPSQLGPEGRRIGKVSIVHRR
jgi:hypothetical protein